MGSWQRFFWALVLTGGLMTGAQAEVQALGQVSVPVADRETGSRNQAIAQGLERVLVRLSGQVSPRQLPGANALFGEPARWVQQFGYEKVEAPPAGEEPTEAQTELQLAMQFDVSAVIGAMEKVGLPVWSTHRPPVLVWLVIQRPGFGEILSRDMSDPLRAVLLEQARLRGLPLILPVMNDRDQASIGPADIRGRFDQVIDQASAPYGARFRLVAVMYTGSTARLRWRLLDGTGEVAAGELEGDDELALVAALANKATDYFVARYTVRAGAGVERRLTVRGVDSLADWRVLEQYLAGLAGIKQARMASVTADEVQFALVFAGEDEQLMRLLEVNRHLEPCDEPAPVAPVPSEPTAPPEEAPGPGNELAPMCWQP